jgi:hypothetical protein
VVRAKWPWSGVIPHRYSVFLDDRLIGKLRRGQSVERRVGPGTHEIYVRAPLWHRSPTLVTEIAAGEEATVRCAFDPRFESFRGSDGDTESIRIWREDGPVPESFHRRPGARVE